jgi:phosphatidylserine/phosphatidylglycerophosphate/cardiolipin synthase-like enzyme
LQLIRFYFIAVILAQLVLVQSGSFAQGSISSSSWDVYFSPRGGATFAVRQALDNARSSVLVQAYSFTSAPIAEALVKAHKRGVKIRVLLDKSQKTEKYSSADFLANTGISTKIDAAHAIAHNKVMIIDKEIVITGSFNFTKAAEESNAENLLVVRDKELASRYTENWQLHEEHSESYRLRTERKK